MPSVGAVLVIGFGSAPVAPKSVLVSSQPSTPRACGATPAAAVMAVVFWSAANSMSRFSSTIFLAS
ncbi:hypothetical protein D3C86_1876350 [compost metagenome]